MVYPEGGSGVLIKTPPPTKTCGFCTTCLTQKISQNPSPSHLYDTEILVSIWSHITTQQWVIGRCPKVGGVCTN